jgi:hypothetical protein
MDPPLLHIFLPLPSTSPKHSASSAASFSHLQAFSPTLDFTSPQSVPAACHQAATTPSTLSLMPPLPFLSLMPCHNTVPPLLVCRCWRRPSMRRSSQGRAHWLSSSGAAPPRRHVCLKSRRSTLGRTRVGEAPKRRRRTPRLRLVVLVQLLIAGSSPSVGLPRCAMAGSSRQNREARKVKPGRGYSRPGGPCVCRPMG